MEILYLFHSVLKGIQQSIASVWLIWRGRSVAVLAQIDADDCVPRSAEHVGEKTPQLGAKALARADDREVARQIAADSVRLSAERTEAVKREAPYVDFMAEA
jgi:hypothetical protein